MTQESHDLERTSLMAAAGALLLGDPRELAQLAAHPAAFRGKNRELLEHLAIPLRESNQIEFAMDALAAAGRHDLADILIGLAGADALSVLERPWASVECMRRQDEGRPATMDLLIEGIPVTAGREFARSAFQLGAKVFGKERI